MSRFESFSHSVYETRRVLRDRLGRMLRPAHEQVTRERSDAFNLPDVDMLELLLRVRITHNDDAATVRAAYDAHRSTHPEAPTFDALLDDGWFGIAWGRITTELETHGVVRQQTEALRDTLNVVLDAHRRDGIAFAFDDVSALPEAAQPLAMRLIEHPNELSFLSAPSADWIVARLWERRPAGDDEAALHWWVDRWRLLGKPMEPPTRWWSKAEARAWREAAFAVLQTDPGLVKWEREKALVDALRRIEWESVDEQRRAEWERVRTPVMPTGLVDRWGWINGWHRDHWGRALELCGDTWVLMAVLCEDLIANERAQEYPSVAELLDLVVNRPTLLVLFAIRIQQHPALLADVLLHPSTAAWGCLMVADWSTHPIGVWERPLQAAESAESRERAFADAMAIATLHLRDGQGSINEMADLLVWLHGRLRADVYGTPGRQVKVTQRMLAVVHSELQSLPKQQLNALLEALSFRESDGLGTPRFTAALDLAAFAALADSLNAEMAVAAYVAGLRPDTVPYFPVGLTPPQALALAVAAQRSTTWSTFLAPVDVPAELLTARSADNESTARDRIARALRVHIRVLSRAILAWEGAVPAELVEALTSAIRTGSSSHEEKGRVGAFAARYESGFEASRSEPPLVGDVANAYKRLPDASRAGLNDALLLIDEPLTLALFLQRAPDSFRDKLVARIGALTPEDAASIHSLPEMQGRIEELLNAGALEAASKYMGVERDLKTFGRVEGRAIARLRWELRLALQRSEFDAISQTTLPQGLQPFEAALAQDAIDFYTALAELSNPVGDASKAESLLAGLAHRHPENVAYVVNRFAAYLSQVLGQDLFKRLDVADIPAARAAMNEADRALQEALGVENQDSSIHGTNKALLLLAIGRNEDAYETLKRSRVEKESDRIAAYSVVALARMGRDDEANAALAAGEAAHPNSAVLKAAREHLNLGMPGHFGVLSISTDDPVAAIQSALYRLTQLNLGMQARVVSRETIEVHLTEEIRSAAAGVTSLVPNLREVTLQEDDVTAVLLRILEPRARLFGWSVPDQSKGGWSARGNPGERDLVIRKDGYVISVIEAVVCNQNPKTKTQRKNLTSHFQKLFGYDQCSVFFHIVYSYVESPEEVLTAMTAIAEASPPPAFRYIRTERLPHEDSRPVGFVATYIAQGGGDVKVVCLVMDMKQEVQREAAALAGRTRGSADPRDCPR
jgi:hypothetical protein